MINDESFGNDESHLFKLFNHSSFDFFFTIKALQVVDLQGFFELMAIIFQNYLLNKCIF